MRSLPEALRFTPGVLIQKTAHGHGSPSIRGFTGRQNLLLVDGIRTNNSTWRSGPVQYWNTVDSQAIDRIDVIRSQGSVLYGSDAAGGTVNAFTRGPSFMTREEGQTYYGGNGYYEYRTNGEGSNIGRLELETGVGGTFGIMIGATLSDFGDVSDSAVGRMDGTGYTQDSYDMKAQWALNQDSTITLAHMYLNQDRISRWHRTLQNPGWTSSGAVATPGLFTSNFYDQERSLSYLRYEGTNPMAEAPISRWQATISYQTNRDSESQNRNPDRDSIRFRDIDMSTIGVDLQLESTIGPGSLVYGFDFYYDDVESSGENTNLTPPDVSTETLPVADDSTYSILGVYAQYGWNPLEPLEVIAGARYTYASAELGRYFDSTGGQQGNDSESWDALVGSLRASWKFNEEWSAFGGVSQAFRAPNLNDLSGNQASQNGNTQLGSLNLDPEEFNTFEVGVRHVSETTWLQASAYYTDVNNLITDLDVDTDGDGVADAEIATNAADAYSSGFELEGGWQFAPQWMLSGFVAWQEAREQKPVIAGGPERSLPPRRSYPLTGSLALRWTSESERLWVEARALAAAEEDRVTAADLASDSQRIPTPGTPSYIVGFLRAGWQATDYLELTASLENITDTDYRVHGSGQNEPGFGAVIGARLIW